MSFDLEIKNKGLYLHTRIEGVQCLRNFKEVWDRIGRECHKQGSRRILCEGCLEGAGAWTGGQVADEVRAAFPFSRR